MRHVEGCWLTRVAWLSACAWLATGCSASDGGDKGGPGRGSGDTAGAGSGATGRGSGGGASQITIDVDFEEVVQEFWAPPKFAGTGCTPSDPCTLLEGCGSPCVTGLECARGLACSAQGVCGPEAYDFGKAVQGALWFFNVNKSGPGITHTYVQWRGDSHLEDGHIQLAPMSTDPNGVNMSQSYIDQYRGVLDPDGDGELDMAGGFYDAGDFLKIGMTTHYAAHTIAWTLWEFPETFERTGLLGEALGILKWFSDYMLKNTYIENPDEPDPWKWNVVAYGHQVGMAADHECGWMPPELRRTSFCPRPGMFATHENPAADVTAGAAAALALTGWHFRLIDREYAARCLKTAIALYEFARQYPNSGWSVDGGLYEAEYAYDDLAWAALWLHEVLPDADQPGATDLTRQYAAHKPGYIDDVIKVGGWLDQYPGFQADCFDLSETCWTESWGHVWRSLRSGVFVKLAAILARSGGLYGRAVEGYRSIARDDSLAWALGPRTDGGFSHKVDVSWGSGRYNSAGQLVALAYAKSFPEDVVPSEAYASAVYTTSTGQPVNVAGARTADILIDWARSQSEYLLGNNPLGESYMMGYGDDYAENVHHAATHASIYGLCGEPAESKHVAYGALVSGPNSGDSHSDDRCDYGANEITIDYNAVFLGALAGNYAFQGAGQCPDPAFPPPEPPMDEFYTEGRVNASGACRSQVEITLVNETAQPPRFDKDLTVRYYVDLSELQAQGIDPSAVTASIIHDNEFGEPTLLSELTPCKLNTSTFYFELAYPYEFWGRQVKLAGPRTVTLELGVADTGACTWDASNDWSFMTLTSEVQKTKPIPAYRRGEIVWGEEPECNEPPKKVIPPEIIR